MAIPGGLFVSESHAVSIGTPRAGAKETLSLNRNRVSGVQPLFKALVQPAKHFCLVIFAIPELAPPQRVLRFPSAFKFPEELFHKPRALAVFIPQMLAARFRRLALPSFGS